MLNPNPLDDFEQLQNFRDVGRAGVALYQGALEESGSEDVALQVLFAFFHALNTGTPEEDSNDS